MTPGRQLCYQLPGYRTGLIVAAMGVIGMLIVSSSHHLRNFAAADSDQVALSGTVRYLGKPLARGKILFHVQLVEPQHDLVNASAAIHDGKFAIAQVDGPEPGWFVVTIEPDPEPDAGWRKGSIFVQATAEDDGVARTALMNRMLLQIKPGRRNEFHFDLN